MDVLFAVFVGSKNGVFKDPNKTVVAGDVCWWGDATKPYGPGTGEIWKSGRFGYFRVNGITPATARRICSPARSVIVDLEGHRAMKFKYRYALPEILRPALSRDWETPGVLELSDVSEDKEKV